MSEPTFEEVLEREEKGLEEIEELFREESFFERFASIFKGFSAARETKAYKTARIELQRLSAPVCAVLLPVIAVALLVLLATGNMSKQTVITVEYLQPEEMRDLEKPEDPLETPPPDIMPPEMDFVTDINTPVVNPIVAPVTPMTAQPATVDSVLQVKSPVIMRGMVGVTRNAGIRGQLLKAYGGNEKTEDAVMRALRWLKKNQLPDGSWPNNKVAMTGLAVLTFLAHGEIPGSTCPEFGETVQRGIEFLIRSQTPGSGRISGSYAHAMATYALCEAYGMTMNPNVKDAADKAVYVLVNGQNPGGGWDYGLSPCERDDTSLMGWCAQSLKAAHLANAYYDKAALEQAMKKSIRGFQRNHQSGGGFGYTGPGAGGLSGVGTLSMQLLGAGNSAEVRNTLTLMDAWVPALTAEQGGIAGSTQYYYYYATQAKFHSGGKRWDSWNDKMWPIYVSAQKIEAKAIADTEGVLQDIGWWENTDAHTDRPVMDTCLVALQLMVYYRNLPTTQEAAVKADVIIAEALDAAVQSDDITVDVGNL